MSDPKDAVITEGNLKSHNFVTNSTDPIADELSNFEIKSLLKRHIRNYVRMSELKYSLKESRAILEKYMEDNNLDCLEDEKVGKVFLESQSRPTVSANYHKYDPHIIPTMTAKEKRICVEKVIDANELEAGVARGDIRKEFLSHKVLNDILAFKVSAYKK